MHLLRVHRAEWISFYTDTYEIGFSVLGGYLETFPSAKKYCLGKKTQRNLKWDLLWICIFSPFTSNLCKKKKKQIIITQTHTHAHRNDNKTHEWTVLQQFFFFYYLIVWKPKNPQLCFCVFFFCLKKKCYFFFAVVYWMENYSIWQRQTHNHTERTRAISIQPPCCVPFFVFSSGLLERTNWTETH